MEFIKEFEEFMNKAIDRLLKKPARKHSHWKDKPELHTAQGKHKEALHKEAETLPPRNISGESDDRQNSRVLLEKMDTDQCIQKLVRTEQEVLNTLNAKLRKLSSIGWHRKKKAAMNYCCTLELNNTIREYNSCTLKINHKKLLTKLRDKQAQ